MRHQYACADCEVSFWIEITDLEYRSSLEDHRETCPGCGQRTGRAHVTCRGCGAPFEVEVPHIHVRCGLANARCPRCGTQHLSPCIC